jgi:NAD(P)-dependent dehydrogenase (short-subunit alcohol dehydrogenase family)
MAGSLTGKVALVAGATRGAGRGTAVALGEAGATVYCTGRTTRAHRSEYDRPETIEETAELVDAAGGQGIAVEADHLEPAQVEQLVRRIDDEQGRLDVLVNDTGAARSSSSGTSRCGSTTSRAACGCCASRSTRTSSRATSRSRCSSAGRAGSSSR